MSSIIISGDTSGSVTLSAPAVAGSTTLTLPVGTATLTANGLNSNIVAGTAVASTSGTSITFTGIPSFAKRITVIFNGVSTSGTSLVQVQIGSGSVTTSGYVSQGAVASTVVSTSSSTTGFLISNQGTASDIRSGNMIITLLSGNIYVASSTIGSSAGSVGFGGGNVTLSGTLDRVVITTVNGTDTFDAGSINILYE
jgi:hypothetical protein